MLRDIMALVAVTATMFGLMAGGAMSPVTGAVALALAPMILGLGRGLSGCLGQLVRIALVVVVLPGLALVDLFEGAGVGLIEAAGPLAPALVPLILLVALYMVLGGETRRRFWKFLGLVPILIGIVVLGAGAGISPALVVFFLVSIVVPRLFSLSQVAERWGGPGVERSSSATPGDRRWGCDPCRNSFHNGGRRRWRRNRVGPDRSRSDRSGDLSLLGRPTRSATVGPAGLSKLVQAVDRNERLIGPSECGPHSGSVRLRPST